MKLVEKFDFILAGLILENSCWSILLQTTFAKRLGKKDGGWLKVTVVLWGTCMSVSNFTVYIYRDVAACDGLNNQRSARHMSREVGVVGNHNSPSETGMKVFACETTQKHQSQTVVTTITDNSAALLRLLSMTVRFVHRLCRGRAEPHLR